MSEDRKSKNFCKSDDAEVVNFDDHEYMVLFKALDPIRVYSRDFLDGKLSQKEAFTKIKTEYSSYKCNLKKELESSRNNKDIVRDIFKIVIFVISSIYSYYVIKQIYRYLTGFVDCSGVSYKIPILYSVVSLILFNPLFSLITVTSSMVKYRASNNVSAESRNKINMFEEAIEEVLSCDNHSGFTKDKVCSYYGYLTADCGSHCPTECSTNNENILKDVIGNKMEKMDTIDQYFKNQERFVYKSHNRFIEIKEFEQIDPKIKFCLGSDVEENVRNNLNMDEDKFVISTNSQDIRNNIVNYLKALEGYKFEEIGEVSDYDSYFITGLNEKLVSLTDNVLRFLETRGTEELNKYFTNNDSLKNYGNNRTIYLFHMGSGYTPDEYEENILLDMLEIQHRLRRLNMVWLPEYEDLRKLLYEPVTNIDVFITSKTKLEVQRTLYGAKTKENLKGVLLDIVTIVLNNPNLIKFGEFEDVCKNTDTSILYPKTVYCNENATHKLIKPNTNINVDTLYTSGYKHKETMLMPRVKEFINKLKTDVLPDDYTKQYKMESEVVNRILINSLEPYLKNERTLIEYISTYIDTNHVFKAEEEKNKQIFKTNCNKIVKSCNKQINKESSNEDLYLTSNDGVEYPNRYISYQEFEIKLLNIDKQQFNKYTQAVGEASSSMSFFMDKIGTLDNKTEEKYQMTRFYRQYIFIYIIASFFVLVELCLTQYYGPNSLDYQGDIICQRKRENKRMEKQTSITTNNQTPSIQQPVVTQPQKSSVSTETTTKRQNKSNSPSEQQSVNNTNDQVTNLLNKGKGLFNKELDTAKSKLGKVGSLLKKKK